MAIPDFYEWENSLDHALNEGLDRWLDGDEQVEGEVDCRACGRGRCRQCTRKSDNGPCYCWESNHFGRLSAGRLKVVRDG